MQKIILVLLSGLLALGLGWYYFSFAQYAIPAGTGMAAKHLCSLVYVSGLEPERARTIYIDPFIQPLTPFLSVTYDDENKRVTTRGLGGWEARADFREHLGCTVRHGAQELASVNDAKRNSVPLVPATDGERLKLFDTDLLAKALDAGFADDTGRKNTLAILVLHGGKLITERYAEGINATTALPGWSMTKSVTATLVGILQTRGIIDVNQPGAISRWRGTPDPRAEITVDQLLRMTSGLEITEDQTGADPNSQMLFGEPDGAAYSANRPLQAAPGSHWQYMSGSTVLVSSRIREVTGDSLQANYDFVQDALFRPLGMSSAILEPDESGTFIGSSFMLASARDWAKFGQLYLDRGNINNQQVFSPGWIEYVSKHTPEAQRTGYGSGFWLNQSDRGVLNPALPEDGYYADGFQGQYIVIVPSKSLVVVRLGASYGGSDVFALVEQIIDAMIPIS